MRACNHRAKSSAAQSSETPCRKADGEFLCIASRCETGLRTGKSCRPRHRQPCFGCTKRGQSAAFAMRVRVAGAPFAVGRVMRGEAERALLNITGEPRGPDSSSVVSGIPVGAVACCCCAACFTCWGFLLSHPSALTYSALGTQHNPPRTEPGRARKCPPSITARGYRLAANSRTCRERSASLSRSLYSEQRDARPSPRQCSRQSPAVARTSRTPRAGNRRHKRK